MQVMSSDILLIRIDLQLTFPLPDGEEDDMASPSFLIGFIAIVRLIRVLFDVRLRSGWRDQEVEWKNCEALLLLGICFFVRVTGNGWRSDWSQKREGFWGERGAKKVAWHMGGPTG